MHQVQRESALDPTTHRPDGGPATSPEIGLGRSTDWCPFDEHVRISPWLDPVVDRRGHDPRSSYVEKFWLGTLGPPSVPFRPIPLRRMVGPLEA